MNKTRRVSFVIPELTGGGAERILLEIMGNIDRDRYEGFLVLFNEGGRFKGDVPDDMGIHILRESRHYRVAGLVRIIYKLYRLFRRERPDLVMSVINVGSFPAIVAARLAGVRVIAYEVSHPRLDIEQEFAFPRAAKLLLRLTYPRADLVLALSEGIKSSLISDFGMSPSRIEVLYTAFETERIRDLASETPEHLWFSDDIPVVLGIGTLVERKGFHHLIKAMAIVNRETPARLIVLGEGPMKQELYALAESLRIRESVDMAGFEPNPWKWLGHASVFVLSSIHEGLGNVIIEAMISGVPVVSTDCPVGPREILGGGEYGLLVPVGDYEAMAIAILRLLNEPTLRQTLSEKAAMRINDFDRSVIMPRLHDLIDNVMK
jgi:glycosyltransferase involved in cell wall biosynthesis